MYEIMFMMFIFVGGIYFFRYLPLMLKYRKSKYGAESGVGLVGFLFNTGNFGEGLTFFELERIDTYSKILTNLYIPTEEGTTEIDLLFIAPSGIYVLESKNYSGWIFGSEKSKNWTTVIFKSKHKFFNPIWQNNKHIKYLKMVLENTQPKSIVVFSDRCELKKLNVGRNVVVQRKQLKETILNDLAAKIYTNEQIDEFYNIMKRYANQSMIIKEQHINQLKNNSKQ